MINLLTGLILIGGVWAQNDLSDWFKNLHNPLGTPCCDTSDGQRVEDPNYRENEDGTYEVFSDGAWIHVDREHIVTATNRIGYAVLWRNKDSKMVYCFMPGARG